MTADRDNALGIYISIRFCRSKCTYCNFASGVYPASDHARYVDRLIHDLIAAERWALEMGGELPRVVDPVYLGGGSRSRSPDAVPRVELLGRGKVQVAEARGSARWRRGLAGARATHRRVRLPGHVALLT